MKTAIRSDDANSAARAGTSSTNIEAMAQSRGVADHRPEATVQHRFQLLANDSNRVQQRGVTDRIGASTRQQIGPTVQRISAGSATGVVQRVTDLHVQQGPSCWLFVLEAVAKSQGVGTNAMRMIMESYASSDAADERVKLAGQEAVPRTIGRRRAALEVTARGLGGMVAALDAYRTAAHNTGNISSKVTERYARANMDGDRSVAYLTFGADGMAPVSDVITQYQKAHARALKLVGIVTNQPDDVGSLLQSGTSEFDQNSDINDVHLTLENVSIPAYMAIRKRFSPTKDELQAGNVVDLTGRPGDTLKDTAHAVLLEAYDRGNKVVSYKDPNFGNVIFRVGIGQLQEMANDSRVLIRPFITSGVSKSRLAEIAD